MSINATDFTRFMNDARVALPGSSDAGIKQALFSVLTEFFIDTSIWIETQPITTVANTTDYTLAQDEGLTVSLVGVVDKNNTPVAAMMPTVDVLTLRDNPNGGDTLTVYLKKTIKLPTTKEAVPLCPDWVFPRYHVTILDGVLGRMMMTIKKSYSDKEMGTFHWRRYRDGIAQARVAALHGNTFGAQRWVFPQEGVSGSQRGGVSVGSDMRFTP